MGIRGSALGLLALAPMAVAAPAAQPRTPLELEPSSRWIVDYDADSCALRRGFDDAAGKMTLEFRQYAPGDAFQVILASDYLNIERGSPEVKFEPDNALLERPDATMGTFGDGVSGLFYQDSFRPNADKNREDPPTPWSADEREARERAITGLVINDGFTRDLVLRTGEMHRPMEAMRSCLDELLTHWGVDVDAHRTLSRPAMPKDMARWVRRVQEHYPADMLRARRGGYIRIRLMVSEAGEPTSCAVQIETPHDSFEETACDTLMRYARFEPALDARQQPIASYYVTAILYQLSY
jgi:TonB family protein